MSQEEKYSIRELQMNVLNILKFVDQVCRDNDIQYYLAYGTLLGAVRHQGFIPWDDDVDLWMFRADFERFVKAMGQYRDGRYQLHCPENDDDWPLNFGKVFDTHTKVDQSYFIKPSVLGTYVDIFPLDGMAEDGKTARREFIKFKVMNSLRSTANHSYFPEGTRKLLIKKASAVVGRIRSTKQWTNAIEKDARKRKTDDGNYVGAVTCQYYSWQKNRFRKEYFDECRDVPFEDGVFRIPARYDEILKTIYGDYMQLPPEDKRHATHIYKILSLGENE